MYSVFVTKTFEEIFNELDNHDKIWIEKIKDQLAINPTGKIIQYSWFREKKFHNKRLYFIVDFELRKVLILDYNDKKEQQKVIDLIQRNMLELLRLIKTL